MSKTDRIHPATYSGFFAACVAATMLAAIPAQGGSMGNGARQRNMVGVNKCLAMPHDKMMKDQACQSMMHVHPELFPAGSLKPRNPAQP